MREIRRPGNYTCQAIRHTLKFQDVLESSIMTKGIATVKPTANKSSFGDSKIHIPVNTTKVTNVIKAATTNLLNMLPKFKLLSKVTPKFRAETASVKCWFSIGAGKKKIHKSCFCVPIIQNSGLFAFNFKLLSVIQWNMSWRQSLDWFRGAIFYPG